MGSGCSSRGAKRSRGRAPLPQRRPRTSPFFNQSLTVVMLMPKQTAIIGCVKACLSREEELVAATLPRLRRAGTTVRVRLPALGRTVDGAIAAVLPVADDLARTVTVRVPLAVDGSALAPGMSAIGLVPTGTREPTLQRQGRGVPSGRSGMSSCLFSFLRWASCSVEV